MTDRRTGTAIKESLTNCRNEEKLQCVWKYAENLCETIKEIIQGT